MIAGIDTNDRVYKLDTFEEILTDVSGGVRVIAALLLVVGMIALLLAFAGIYAVLSYLIAVQSRDIAIRMSLGATPRRIVSMFLAYLSTIVIPSLMFGVFAGLAFGRVLARMVSAIELTPPAVATMVAVVLCASVVSTLIPARRIATISPASAARNS